MPERPTQIWTDFDELLLACLNFPSGKRCQASTPQNNSIYLLPSGITQPLLQWDTSPHLNLGTCLTAVQNRFYYFFKAGFIFQLHKHREEQRGDGWVLFLISDLFYVLVT